MRGWVRLTVVFLFVSCDLVIDALIYQLLGTSASTSNWIAAWILLVKIWLACFLFMEREALVPQSWQASVGSPIILFLSLTPRIRVVYLLALLDGIFLQLALLYRESPVPFRICMSVGNLTTVALVGSLVKLSRGTFSFDDHLERHPETQPLALLLHPFLDLIENLFSIRSWIHRLDEQYIQGLLSRDS